MDATEYRKICSRPDAFQRRLLELTQEVLLSVHPPSAELMQRILDTTPIPKPELHTGGEEADYFLVDLDVAEAEQVMEYLVDAEAGAVGPQGETTQEASRVGELIDAWVRYVDLRDGTWTEV